MSTHVYYNGIELPGTPFVSRSETPIDYGDRWGMNESITLNGTLTEYDHKTIQQVTNTRTINVHWNLLNNGEAHSLSNQGGSDVSKAFLQSLLDAANTELIANNVKIQLAWDQNDYSSVAVANGIDYMNTERTVHSVLPGTNQAKLFNMWFFPAHGGSSMGFFPDANSNGPNPDPFDGIILNSSHVYDTRGANIDPQILVHEIGHYLGLFHTFQPDQFADTPPHTSTWDDCANPPLSDDGVNPVPINNYMNYSFCSDEFTTEQIDFMNAVLDTFRSELVADEKIGGAQVKTNDWQALVDIFKVNFQEFKVVDNGADYLTYPSVMIESIDFPEDKWSENGLIKYSVKLKAYDILDSRAGGYNVIEPSDSSTFTENDDGTVSLVRKTSAKGIKTIDTNAYDNAVNFVQRIHAITSSPPTYPEFIKSANSAVLINSSEASDRLAGTFSITKNYKYENKAFGRPRLNVTEVPVVTTHKLDLNESITNDYNSIKYELRYQGSNGYEDEAQRNFELDHVRQTMLDDLEVSQSDQRYISDTLNVPEALIFRTTFTLEDDPASTSLTYKASYVTGFQDAKMLEGYFDHKVSVTTDGLTDISIWSIDGEFKTWGTLPEKRSALQNFKNSVGKAGMWEPYLVSQISQSELEAEYLYPNAWGRHGECSVTIPKDKIHGAGECAAAGGAWTSYDYDWDNKAGAASTANPNNFYVTSIKVNENTGLGTLSLSATFSDEDRVHHSWAPDPINHQLSSSYPHVQGNVEDWQSTDYFYPGGGAIYWNASPIKYNVQVTEGIDTYKIIPSANVEGLFALQNLNCKTKAKTKISINGTLTARSSHQQADNDAGEHSLLYNLQNETLRAVEYQLFSDHKNAWRTDEDSDFTSIFTMSRSKEFTYDPSDQNKGVRNWQKEVYDEVAFEIFDTMGVESTRDPGYKFGW